MRKFLNTWLRRWAEASLRNELHQTQEKLIKLQEVRLNLLSKAQEQTASIAKREKALKKRHVKAVDYDTKLIKALRARMSDEMFCAVANYVRDQEESKP